jgi:nucleoside-diphosphate-sugar epimerase
MALFLVTGGAGFIGSNIVEELVKRGEKVRVLDNFSTAKRENLSSLLGKIELIEGDIRSYHIVREAVEGVDIISHQAALPSVPRSIKDPITTNEVNVGGTLNILMAARDAKVKRVVYASSSSVYGNSDDLPMHEAMTPNPLSPYAVSKLAGEKYCQIFSQIHCLETICLRYFNVFGPRQDPNSQYSAVIPKFVKAMLNDEQPVIYGDGEQSRDFTYVANVVEANLLAGTASCQPGLVVNCASHGQTTLNELVDSLNRILNKSIKPKYEIARTGDIKHSFASIEKIKNVLGYAPLTGFERGLMNTCQSYAKTEKRAFQ